MKTINLVTIFTITAFLTLGCNDKRTGQKTFHDGSGAGNSSTLQTDGRSQNQNTIQMGGETHGGDVLYARAEEIRFLLTATDEEIEKKLLDDNPWIIRQSLYRVFEGLDYYLNTNAIEDSKISEILDKMFEFQDGKNIYSDIYISKFNVLMPPDPNSISGTERKEFCRNIDGNISTAAAKLNDLGGNICVDAERLAKEAPQLKDLVSLVAHEMAHHFGADEEKAHLLQNYIMANFDHLDKWGQIIQSFTKRHHLLNGSSLRIDGEPIVFEITIIENAERERFPNGPYANEINPFAQSVNSIVKNGYDTSAGYNEVSLRWKTPAVGTTKTFELTDNAKLFQNQTISIWFACGIMAQIKIKIGDFESNVYNVGTPGDKCDVNGLRDNSSDSDQQYFILLL